MPKHSIKWLYVGCLLLIAGCGAPDSGTTTAPGADFKIPDTGQTTSYTNTFGEDNDYTINPPSYTDNGDGTITDNVTGLVWQKQDDGVAKTWDDAVTYCNNLTLAGQTGWRLPSRIEIVSIVDYGVYNPSINVTFFPDTISSAYWSSTLFAGWLTNSSAYWSSTYASGAWSVYFFGGSSDLYGSSYYARCVKGGQTTPRLTDNGNGTVTDSGNLLTWQQDDSTMTWEAALTHCDGLTLAAQTDWRLPNIKELLSIVDDTRTSPAINKTLFPNTPSSPYWSSTTDAQYTGYALSVDFSYGYSPDRLKTDLGYVRCVRGGQ